MDSSHDQQADSGDVGVAASIDQRGSWRQDVGVMLGIWLLLVVLAVGGLWTGIEQERGQHREEFAADTELVAEILGDFLDDQIRILEDRSAALLADETPDVDAMLGIAQSSGLAALGVFDADGLFLGNMFGVQELVGQDFTLINDHLRRAVETGQPTVSKVVISPSLLVPAVAVVSPYQTSFGTRYVAGVFTVNTATLSRQLQTRRSIGATRIEVIDDESHLIVSTASDLPNELVTLDVRYPNLAKAVDESESSGSEYSGFDGVDYYAEIADVPGTGWRLIASAPTDSLYNDWDHPTFVAGSALILLLIAFGLTGVFVVASIRQRHRVETAAALSTREMLQVEVDEVHRAEAEVELLAMTDDLTGLLNRRGFIVQATQAISRGKRDALGVLLFIDIDGLKEVNDRFGHLQGDEFLVATADVLRDSFRQHDLTARLGGDEFTVFVPHWDDDLNLLIHRLLDALERRNQRGDLPIPIKLSVGLATTADDGPPSINDLIRAADAAMYVEKQEHRRSQAPVESQQPRDEDPLPD